MKKILLHIDSRPEFLGQVLQVTDDSSGEIVPYGIVRVNDLNDISRLITSSKITLHNCASLDKQKNIARYFTAMLGAAVHIDVYGDQVKQRYPSTCAYTFDLNQVPLQGADPPFNFDYGRACTIIPVSVALDEALTAASLAAKEAASSFRDSHAVPGITSDEEFLTCLRKYECHDGEETSVGLSWNKDFRTDWYPVIRQDGRIGVYKYRSSSGAVKLFLIAESALPYYVCDQLLILIRENPKKWTWKQWAESQEIKQARLLARATVEDVLQRTLKVLSATVGMSIDVARALSETMTVTSNILRVTGNHVTYDVAISRPIDWHAKKTLLTRFVTSNDGTVGFALLRNMDHARKAFDKIIPNVFVVPSIAEVESVIRQCFGESIQGRMTVDVLTEVF